MPKIADPQSIGHFFFRDLSTSAVESLAHTLRKLGSIKRFNLRMINKNALHKSDEIYSENILIL